LDNKPTVLVQWLAVGSGTISLLEKSAYYGCKDSSFQSITIGNTVPPNISGNYDVCINNMEIYTTIPVEGYTYKWSVQNGTILGIDNSDTVRVQWVKSGSGVISLYVINSSTGFADSAKQTITVYSLPTPKIIGLTTADQGSSAHYSVQGNLGSKFKWLVSGGSILNGGNLPDLNVQWGNSSAGQLNVSETTKENCVDSSSLNISLSPVDVQESGYGASDCLTFSRIR